ncbi:MAG: histidinol-phosphate aminotransferase family protein [Candidatus Aminicenantes bacterium]|nr:MAG: histidinol-phosphate aminotransferase family protein [Candidatus Aminicenantes bacterium]
MKSKVKIKTQSFFNIGTQRALYEKVGGYISKEFYIQEYIKILKERYNLKKIYRFDLGQNNDGCAEEVAQRFKELSKSNIRQFLKNYPEFICLKLREKIARLHNIFPEWIQLSAGLEQMLAHIASSFLELNDRILVTSPTFYLFEEFSRRMGAVPIYLYLREEDNFDWLPTTFDEYKKVLGHLNPKLIWIANPNNPSGVFSPPELVKDIVKEAADHYAFVVMDEAYGEYTDPAEGVLSASSLLHEYKNLIVLRTFSKGYGLANLRVGYAMSSDDDILRALKVHRTYFPITQFSFDFAKIALDHMDYLETVRKRAEERKKYFIKKIKDSPHIIHINSETNVMMVRHIKLSASRLMDHLEKHGIIVAKVPGEDSILKRYIRATLGTKKELDYFTQVLKKTG